MFNTSLNESRDLDCPAYGNHSDYYIGQVNFWVEGVLQTALAIPGLIGKLSAGTRELYRELAVHI